MDGVQNEGDSGRATASRRKNRQWVFILVVVVVVIADVAALSIKFLLTNSNTAPSGLPAGITLTQFEARVEQQVRSRTSRGFGVASAKSTRCFMGTAWKPGQQFNCFVYDSAESSSARSTEPSCLIGARSMCGTACGYLRQVLAQQRVQVRRHLDRNVHGRSRQTHPEPALSGALNDTKRPRCLPEASARQVWARRTHWPPATVHSASLDQGPALSATG